ncbi:class I SAM-dependent methyltransferase [Acanthopleuribacter pedis]|uniref:Methyltransferase domain-containing protein n=1 Tax=Acanthopleuribacter pedis TaxID=442870 RepID=A0A8J7QGU3_9BACT|nr:class I SAM-dependent methyltransferase [Acanthopleuribacter pedis]MBO1319895.1 methyltransferase domain-containing protein [Acanthopleuribacter pedis]
MDDFQLLIDLHLPAKRQGPGSPTETKRALELAGLRDAGPLKVADIGCGTGATSIALANELDVHITAVDLLPTFLETLNQRAEEAGVAGRITTLEASMDALPFEEEHFDVIWSEGAVYNMGFSAGVSELRRFLKPDGMLLVSEITWLTDVRPQALYEYWTQAYPEIDTASAKLAVLEDRGFSPVAYFVLPKHCWLEHYYEPMEQRFETFLEKYENSDVAKALVASEKQEIALYRKYCDYYSYGFYIARKI